MPVALTLVLFASLSISSLSFAQQGAADVADNNVADSNVAKTITVAANPDKTPPIRVVYISPFITAFWADVRRFMLEVASDLNIEVELIEAGSRFQLLQAAEQLQAMEDTPDFLIFQYQHGISQELFKVANERGIKSFVINTDIPDKELNLVGSPRQKMPLWIGHVFSDNVDVGYTLADELIQKAKIAFPENKKFRVLAMGGDGYGTVGERRATGMIQRLAEDKNVKLQRTVDTRWIEENSYKSTYELLQLYPDINIIWAASDLLAHGSINALQKLGFIPGKDIIVGGVDWTLDGINAVEEGRMSVSLGGHFMEGGWALILINDYYHGLDFKQELGVRINLPMSVIDRDNAATFSRLFTGDDWKKIDFKQFSKFYNRDRTHYHLSVDAVFTAYQQQSSKTVNTPHK